MGKGGNPYHDEIGRFTTASLAQTLSDGLAEEHSRRTPRLVSGAAYRAVKRSGGVTIDLKGRQPTRGYAYSPSKDTETIIPKSKLRLRDIDNYIDAHYEALSKKGSHLGMWTSDNDVYLDVSYVGPPNAATIAKAQRASQLAVFDLEKFNEIAVGSMTKSGKYRRRNDAASIHHQYRRQVERSDQGRSA